MHRYVRMNWDRWSPWPSAGSSARSTTQSGRSVRGTDVHWLLVLLYWRARRRLRKLDHAHELSNGDRRPLGEMWRDLP